MITANIIMTYDCGLYCHGIIIDIMANIVNCHDIIIMANIIMTS